jgi:Zn-dependent M28 family amino/carboxypeptidase
MRQALALVAAGLGTLLVYWLWRRLGLPLSVFLALLVLALAAAIPLWLVTQPFVGAVPTRAPDVHLARLEEHVRVLSVDLHPRSLDLGSRLDEAADYIRDELSALGANVREQEVVASLRSSRNIIARFGPATGSLLVIGAHYDSCSAGFDASGATPGADDNASGVAGLLELARLLAAAPPRQPVELVAYTLEEPPSFGSESMGSVWHARSLSATGQTVRLMVSLEMIGFFSDQQSSQSFPLSVMGAVYPTKANFIALVGRVGDFAETRRAKALMAGATDLPVVSMNAPRWLPGVDFSDHRSYWSEGFPALMITDTAFYRNANYHAAGDTHDTLDYARMAKVVQAAYAIAQGY